MEKRSLPESRKIIAYRMSRAWRTLSEEKHLLGEEGSTHSVVSRLYFAVFYAISALLLIDGLGSKKHAAKRGVLVDRLVSSGRISKTDGKTYHELVAVREAADHEDMVWFSTEQVTEWLVPAEQLIKEVETLLKSLGHLEN